MSLFTTKNYGEYAASLAQACNWLSSLGVNYKKSRFGNYLKIWNRLDQCQKINRIDQFQNEIPFTDWMNAAFETSELLDIHEGLCDIDDPALTARVKEICKGQELYTEDNSESSSRDFGFELKIASKFARHGFNLNFASESDIELDYFGTDLFIECKRIKSAKKSELRILEAQKQLSRRYEKSSRPHTSRGFVAISISKLCNPNLYSLEGSSPPELSVQAEKYIKEFCLDKLKTWGNDNRMLGAVVSLDCPAILKPSNTMLSVHQLGIIPKPGLSTKELDFFKMICNYMSPN